jgi:hypothetical protein
LALKAAASSWRSTGPLLLLAAEATMGARSKVNLLPGERYGGLHSGERGVPLKSELLRPAAEEGERGEPSSSGEARAFRARRHSTLTCGETEAVTEAVKRTTSWSSAKSSFEAPLGERCGERRWAERGA